MSLPVSPSSPAPRPVTPLGRVAQAISDKLRWVEAAVILLSATGMVLSLLWAMLGAQLLKAGFKNVDGETLSQAADTALALMVWVGAFGASEAVRVRLHLVLGAPPAALWRRKLSEALAFGIAAGLAVTLVRFALQMGQDQPPHKVQAMWGLTLAGCTMSLRYLLCLLGADPPAPSDTPAPPSPAIPSKDTPAWN